MGAGRNDGSIVLGNVVRVFHLLDRLRLLRSARFNSIVVLKQT